jgi:mRNA-degrading endonuclease YafQ of YafQ-DinJ toxin-antitoxin module
MVSIVYSEKFISQFESMPPKVQKIAHKKIEMFCANPKYPSLKTHKLNGVLEGYFSFSVDYQVRIVFEYGEKGIVHFLKIGGHEVYR